MSNIIPFDSDLPALPTTKRLSGINQDVLGSGPAFPILSIKGKVFTLVKGSDKKVLTREVDGEDMPVQSLQATVVRANTKYRVFYATAFNEQDSDGKKPTCYSQDGIAPAANALEPQAKKCMACPKNVWGVRDGKGTECVSRMRLAVVDPSNLEEEPFLLNVPPASRKAWMQAVEQADNRGQDYNRMVVRVSFDREAATPKLVFKPTGWLSDDGYNLVARLYESDIVKDMVGVAHSKDESHVDAEGVAAAVIETAKAEPKRVESPIKRVEDADDVEDVEPKEPAPKAAKPVVKPVKPAVKPAPSDDDLVGEIESLLSSTDD